MTAAPTKQSSEATAQTNTTASSHKLDLLSFRPVPGTVGLGCGSVVDQTTKTQRFHEPPYFSAESYSLGPASKGAERADV